MTSKSQLMRLKHQTGMPIESNYADRATWLSAVAEFERSMEMAAGECICSISAPLTKEQHVMLAHRCASLAVELDYPGTEHLADRLHDIAEELAGERCAEVYAGDNDE